MMIHLIILARFLYSWLKLVLGMEITLSTADKPSFEGNIQNISCCKMCPLVGFDLAISGSRALCSILTHDIIVKIFTLYFVHVPIDFGI